jgi:hypothetical protein
MQVRLVAELCSAGESVLDALLTYCSRLLLLLLLLLRRLSRCERKTFLMLSQDTMRLPLATAMYKAEVEVKRLAIKISLPTFSFSSIMSKAKELLTCKCMQLAQVEMKLFVAVLTLTMLSATIAGAYKGLLIRALT